MRLDGCLLPRWSHHWGGSHIPCLLPLDSPHLGHCHYPCRLCCDHCMSQRRVKRVLRSSLSLCCCLANTFFWRSMVAHSLVTCSSSKVDPWGYVLCYTFQGITHLFVIGIGRGSTTVGGVLECPHFCPHWLEVSTVFVRYRFWLDLTWWERERGTGDGCVRTRWHEYM